MSEDVDRESKTEEPTEKRLQDAAEKGNDPVSREAPLFASLLALLVISAFLLKPAVGRVVLALHQMLDAVGESRLETGADASLLIGRACIAVGLAIAPLLIVVSGFGVAASFAQSWPRFILTRIMPDFQRISLAAGLGRLFGKKGFIAFLKAVLELLIVGFALALVLRAEQARVIDLLFMQPSEMPLELVRLMLKLVASVAAATALIVAGDIVWTRLQWRTDLRMTRQEVKDEVKQSEGDPMVKARLRSIALDRARKRMMAQVPRATLVIANPTHYAIAIRYVREEGGAPLVVAKGQDLIALKIREIAENSGVPVLEQKLLARSMYHLVEVDQVIPPEFYRAVAELIHFLSRKKPGLVPAR